MRMDNNLKSLRKRHKLTQAELGEHVGATKGQISKLETGEQPWTEEWLKRMELAFHRAGFKEIEAWWFIKEPKKPELGEKLQEGFEAAEPHTQQTILDLLRIKE